MLEQDFPFPREILDSVAPSLPKHLQKHLPGSFKNPFDDGGLWPSFTCHSAALSFYANSLEGYADVEERVYAELGLGLQVIPKILDECFKKTKEPSFGDIAVFYRGENGIMHVHGGIYIGDDQKNRLILSKRNVGNMQLDVRSETRLLNAYRSNEVRYWRPKQGSKPLKLEDVYL